MRTPQNVFTIVLPVLSSLGPVFGVGHANAIPAPNAVPDSPKYYFPRHIKREAENTTLSDQLSSFPPETSTTSSSTTSTTITDLDGFLSSLFPSSRQPQSSDDITTTSTIEITTIVAPSTPVYVTLLPTVSPPSSPPPDPTTLTSSSTTTIPPENLVSSLPGSTGGVSYSDPSTSSSSSTVSPTSNSIGSSPPVESLPSPSLPPVVTLPDSGLKLTDTMSSSTSTSVSDSLSPIVTSSGRSIAFFNGSAFFVTSTNWNLGPSISLPPGLVAPSELPSSPTGSLPLSIPTLAPGILPTSLPAESSNSLPPESSGGSIPSPSDPLPTVVLPSDGLSLGVSPPTLPGTSMDNSPLYPSQTPPTEVLSSPTNDPAPLPSLPYSGILPTLTTLDLGIPLPTVDPSKTLGPGLPLVPTDVLTNLPDDGNTTSILPDPPALSPTLPVLPDPPTLSPTLPVLPDPPTLSPTLPVPTSPPDVNYPLPTTTDGLIPVPDTNTTTSVTGPDLPTGNSPPTGYPEPTTTNTTTTTGDAPSNTGLSTSTDTTTTGGSPLVTSGSPTSDLPTTSLTTGLTTGPTTSPTTSPTTGPPDAAKNGTTYGGDAITHTSSSLESTTTTLPWFPPSLATAQASTVVTQVVTGLPGSVTISSATTTQSVETGIPSNYPKVVTPAGGMPPKPDNGTLCRFGFTHELNYAFVVSNPIAVAQIFEYLPKGLAYGLSLAPSDVVIHHLQPFDTLKTKKYITTLAFAFVPTDLVDKLDMDRHNPNSKLFQSPDAPVNQMMCLLDSTIPLRATDSETTGDDSMLPGDGSWLEDGGNDPETLTSDGAPLGNAGSGQVSTKSVGVGLGIVAGAAAYGAAMFFIARRYRQRRNRHTRSSSTGRSISPGSNPAGALMGGTVMHGARSPYGSAGPSHDKRGSRGSGKASARTQNISAPMMAENSLGWN